MKTYLVDITETLHLTYAVRASSPHWAQELVRLAVLTDRDRIEGGDLGKCVDAGADDLEVYDARESGPGEAWCNHDASYLKSGDTCECGEIKP